MKILVINASANKERSTTLKLTKTFLEGLGVEASEVELDSQFDMFGLRIQFLGGATAVHSE